MAGVVEAEMEDVELPNLTLLLREQVLFIILLEIIINFDCAVWVPSTQWQCVFAGKKTKFGDDWF